MPKRGNSILFWGDIAGTTDFKTYYHDFNRIVESGFLDEQYGVQNWFTAKVLRRKFRWPRGAITLFFFALFTALYVYLNA